MAKELNYTRASPASIAFGATPEENAELRKWSLLGELRQLREHRQRYVNLRNQHAFYMEYQTKIAMLDAKEETILSQLDGDPEPCTN